jgi:hypothetical protein
MWEAAFIHYATLFGHRKFVKVSSESTGIIVLETYLLLGRQTVTEWILHNAVPRLFNILCNPFNITTRLLIILYSIIDCLGTPLMSRRTLGSETVLLRALAKLQRESVISSLSRSALWNRKVGSEIPFVIGSGWQVRASDRLRSVFAAWL